MPDRTAGGLRHGALEVFGTTPTGGQPALVGTSGKNIVGSTVMGNKRLYHIEDSMVRRMVQDFLKVAVPV